VVCGGASASAGAGTDGLCSPRHWLQSIQGLKVENALMRD